MSQRSLTLSEVASLLRQKQHRLIYLCEKGVIAPDVQDARGRGSSRRFSRRNLLEFSLALKLRTAMIPATVIGTVIQVLRAFERSVSREVNGFRLPDSLREPRAPELRVILIDGTQLFFSLGRSGSRGKVFGGLDIRKVRPTKDTAFPEGDAVAAQFEKSGGVRVEFSVTQIAKELPSEG